MWGMNFESALTIQPLCEWQQEEVCSWLAYITQHGAGEEKWVYCKHLYCMFKFLYKVDYVKDKFMHAPMYTYNEVMRVLDIVEQ